MKTRNISAIQFSKEKNIKSFFYSSFLVLMFCFCASFVNAESKVEKNADLQQCPANEVLTKKEQANIEKLKSYIDKYNPGYDIISEITEMGPRLAGSKQEKHAQEWSMKKFKKVGLTNITKEEFPIPFWQRGEEAAWITKPFKQKMVMTALGGSKSTNNEYVKGQVAYFKTLDELKNSPIDKSLKGKIVFVDEFMTRTHDGSGYGMAVRKRSQAASEASKRGAVASMIRSVGTDHHRQAHTGQMSYGDQEPIPAIAISPPDADQIKRLFDRNEGNVEVTFKSNSKFQKDGVSANVYADLKGKKDEYILLGSHLDSWDLGTGAIDDASGQGITLGAVIALQQLSGKLPRGIRVIFYGSEEIGIFGGNAYAEKHKDELDKYYLAFESDFGAGEIWQLRTGYKKMGGPLTFKLQQALRPLGIGDGANNSQGGPDIHALWNLGVPAVTLAQNGWDYFDLHHTPNDTFDKVDPENIKQNTKAYAITAYLASISKSDLKSDCNPKED